MGLGSVEVDVESEGDAGGWAVGCFVGSKGGFDVVLPIVSFLCFV